MDNPGEILRLCRLCLVKDQVNIPIFEEQGDIRQIFLKISSCLPVTVSRDDQLPKKICDGCSNKLDLLYEFWNTSANAEKTLLSWLGQAGVKDADETISAVAQQIKPAETQVKEEALEDGHAISQDNFGLQSFDEDTKDEAEPPPRKRARRTAAVKAQISIAPESDDDDDDMDNTEAMTKVEGESEESDGEDRDPSYGEVPGTSADDQAGPSGVGKDGVEAPQNDLFENLRQDDEEILIQFVDDFDETENERSEMTDENFGDANQSDIVESYKNDTTGKKYSCNKCNGYFRMIRRHLETHGPYNCMDCVLNFDTEELYSEHLFSAHDKDVERYPCDQCSLGFSTITYLAVHKFKHTKKYSCPLCSFTAKGRYRNSLINHIKRHEGKYEFKCEICGQGFLEKHLLDDHMEIHEDIPKYACEFCPKKFTVKRYLYVHKSYNHKKELYGMDEKYQCEVCGRNFTFEKSLKRHLSCIHKIGEDRTVECPVCNKIIANNTNLKRHMRVHTGEKRFCCDTCGKAFSEKKYLIKHQNVHAKEKARNRFQMSARKPRKDKATTVVNKVEEDVWYVLPEEDIVCKEEDIVDQEEDETFQGDEDVCLYFAVA